MDVKVYTQEGKEKGKVTLPEGVFDLRWNGDLVHQVITSMFSNARVAIAHTKDRSDVRGGGKKPWQQKGTGRARHGSRRSPIWRGGGITFGPTSERNFSKKINKKMRVKALFTLLSEKLRSGEILFIDALAFDSIKTTKAKEVLKSLSTVAGFDAMKNKRKNAVCIYLPEKDEKVERSFSNFSNVAVLQTRNMNSLDIAKYKYVIVVNPKESISFLEEKLVK